MLINNQCVNKEIKKYLENSENGNTIYEILWDTTKAVLRRKFIAIHAYLKKEEKISNKQPNFTPQGIRKGTTSKAQSQ